MVMVECYVVICDYSATVPCDMYVVTGMGAVGD